GRPTTWGCPRAGRSSRPRVKSRLLEVPRNGRVSKVSRPPLRCSWGLIRALAWPAPCIDLQCGGHSSLRGDIGHEVGTSLLPRPIRGADAHRAALAHPVLTARQKRPAG